MTKGFVDDWLRYKQNELDQIDGARFRTIRLWTVIAAVAGIVAAIAAIVAAWPVVFR